MEGHCHPALKVGGAAAPSAPPLFLRLWMYADGQSSLKGLLKRHGSRCPLPEGLEGPSLVGKGSNLEERSSFWDKVKNHISGMARGPNGLTLTKSLIGRPLCFVFRGGTKYRYLHMYVHLSSAPMGAITRHPPPPPHSTDAEFCIKVIR